MDEQLNEAIDRYCRHFSKQINMVNAVSGESADLFKKILFCSVLDALSRSIYPQKAPRDRFTSLVKRFGRWSHHDRVSLPHLARLLQLIPDPSFEKLRKISLERLASWLPLWNDVKLDQDPKYDEFSKYWPKSDENRMPIQKICLASLTHIQLLYSHRNSLVHELRTPGNGIEMGTDEPFYHDMSTFSHAGEPPLETIELVYPVKFFEHLCNTVLDELKQYLGENHLNPFNSYRFGSYWIEELN